MEETKNALDQSMKNLLMFYNHIDQMDEEVSATARGRTPLKTKQVLDTYVERLRMAEKKIAHYEKQGHIVKYGEFDANDVIKEGVGIDAALTLRLRSLFREQFGNTPDADAFLIMFDEHDKPDERPAGMPIAQWLSMGTVIRFVRCFAVFKKPTDAMMWRLGAEQ